MAAMTVSALAMLFEDHHYIVNNFLSYSFGQLYVDGLGVFDELYRQYVIRPLWTDYVHSWYSDDPQPEIPKFPPPERFEDWRTPYNALMTQSERMQDFCVKLYDSVEENRDLFHTYHTLEFPEKRRCFYISCTPTFIEMEIGQFYLNPVTCGVKLFVQNPMDRIGRRSINFYKTPVKNIKSRMKNNRLF